MEINQRTVIKAKSKTELQEFLNWLGNTHPHIKWVTGQRNTPECRWDIHMRPQDVPEDCGYILCVTEDDTIFFRNEVLHGESYIEDVIEDSRHSTKFVYAQEVIINITPPSKSDLMELLIGG